MHSMRCCLQHQILENLQNPRLDRLRSPENDLTQWATGLHQASQKTRTSRVTRRCWVTCLLCYYATVLHCFTVKRNVTCDDHVMIMWWVLDWADSSSSGSNVDDLRSLWNSSSNQKQLECYKMWVWMWSLAASNELNFKWFCMILWICVIYLLHGSQPQSAKSREYFSICSSILSYFSLQILRTLYSTVYSFVYLARLKIWTDEEWRLPTCPIRPVGCQHTAPSSVQHAP